MATQTTKRAARAAAARIPGCGGEGCAAGWRLEPGTEWVNEPEETENENRDPLEAIQMRLRAEWRRPPHAVHQAGAAAGRLANHAPRTCPSGSQAVCPCRCRAVVHRCADACACLLLPAACRIPQRRRHKVVGAGAGGGPGRPPQPRCRRTQLVHVAPDGAADVTQRQYAKRPSILTPISSMPARARSAGVRGGASAVSDSRGPSISWRSIRTAGR